MPATSVMSLFGPAVPDWAARAVPGAPMTVSSRTRAAGAASLPRERTGRVMPTPGAGCLGACGGAGADRSGSRAVRVRDAQGLVEHGEPLLRLGLADGAGRYDVQPVVVREGQ